MIISEVVDCKVKMVVRRERWLAVARRAMAWLGLQCGTPLRLALTLLACCHVGNMLRHTPLVRLIYPHMNKHMGRIFTGAASTSKYSLGVLRLAMKHGLKNEDPREYMIN